MDPSTTMTLQPQVRHELCFQSLFSQGRGYAFDCNAAGRVDLDALSEQARVNYFYARTLVGVAFSAPEVRPRTQQLAEAQPE